MNITLKQRNDLGARSKGIQWFTAQRTRSLKPLIAKLLKQDHADYARWLLNRLLTAAQRVQWATYAAEQVLPVFEAKYPNDKRPRAAIQAAKDFAAEKISREELKAAYAAANAAAYAAAYAAAGAANAAYAAGAAYAANAARAAAYATYAAVDAAAYAADAAYDKAEMNKKIMSYALKLLGVK